MDISLKGKVALVTGGSRGIGRSIVLSLLESGVRGVTITGRKVEPLIEFAQEIGEHRCLAVAGNVSDDEHLNDAVVQTVAHFGALDILVNNAATSPGTGTLVEMDLGAIDKTWHVNMRAPLVAVRAAWLHWMKDHGGVVVNIGSIAGFRPSPDAGQYNSAKAGLHFLTRQLAFELAPHIRVNAVAAGTIDTDFSSMRHGKRRHEVEAGYPMKRLGTVSDVANAVVFLASDSASWITGEILLVDGGIVNATTFAHVLSD